MRLPKAVALQGPNRWNPRRRLAKAEEYLYASLFLPNDTMTTLGALRSLPPADASPWEPHHSGMASRAFRRYPCTMEEPLIPAATLTVDADRTILVNHMRTSDSVALWTFGAGAVMQSLAQRGAL